jgi:hypothetical protein
LVQNLLYARWATPPTPGKKKRGPTNSELRLRRLTAEETEPTPRGILEIFSEPDPADEDGALARDDDHDD